MNQEEALKWVMTLKREAQVICFHISKDYTIGKMISRGSYFKFNAATHNETGYQYSVKSISKSHLSERPKLLVFIILLRNSNIVFISK